MIQFAFLLDYSLVLIAFTVLGYSVLIATGIVLIFKFVGVKPTIKYRKYVARPILIATIAFCVFAWAINWPCYGNFNGWDGPGGWRVAQFYAINGKVTGAIFYKLFALDNSADFRSWYRSVVGLNWFAAALAVMAICNFKWRKAVAVPATVTATGNDATGQNNPAAANGNTPTQPAPTGNPAPPTQPAPTGNPAPPTTTTPQPPTGAAGGTVGNGAPAGGRGNPHPPATPTPSPAPPATPANPATPIGPPPLPTNSVPPPPPGATGTPPAPTGTPAPPTTTT